MRGQYESRLIRNDARIGSPVDCENNNVSCARNRLSIDRSLTPRERLFDFKPECFEFYGLSLPSYRTASSFYLRSLLDHKSSIVPCNALGISDGILLRRMLVYLATVTHSDIPMLSTLM